MHTQIMALQLEVAEKDVNAQHLHALSCINYKHTNTHARTKMMALQLRVAVNDTYAQHTHTHTQIVFVLHTRARIDNGSTAKSGRPERSFTTCTHYALTRTHKHTHVPR